MKFKPEFEKKLLRLGIKRRFMKNLKEQHCDIEETIDYLNDSYDWTDFVSSAFHWKVTPEGDDFWENKAKNN